MGDALYNASVDAVVAVRGKLRKKLLVYVDVYG
jgi:hypothetical protein